MNGLFSTLFGYAAPYIQDVIATAVTAGAAWLFTMLNSKLGINIETARRDALTASAKRVAGELFTEITAGHVSLSDVLVKAADGSIVVNTSHPAVAQKVAKVQAAAPDALKAFKMTNNVPAIASKIMGELGPLLAQSGILGTLGPVGGIIGGILSGPPPTAAVVR